MIQILLLIIMIIIIHITNDNDNIVALQIMRMNKTIVTRVTIMVEGLSPSPGVIAASTSFAIILR